MKKDSNLEFSSGDHRRKHIILFLIIIISVFLRLFLSFGPMNYFKELGWRTVHSRMITKDIADNGFDIFRTKVYYNGTKVDYIQGFPAYETLTAFFYLIFGEYQIIGRFIAAICFGIALYFFYLLCLFFISYRWTILAVILFSFNYISLSFSYQFQPTSFNIMLTLAVIYYFLKYIHEDKNKYFIIWNILLLLLFLTKITYGAFLIPPIIIKLFQKHRKNLFKIKRYYFLLFITLGLTCAWYAYALKNTFLPYRQQFLTYFADIIKWIFIEKRFYYVKELLSTGGSIFLTSITAIGLVLLLIGFIKSIIKRDYFLPALFISYIILWLVIPFKFMVHPYNFLTLLIPSCILIVIGIETLYKIKSSIIISIKLEDSNKGPSFKFNITRSVATGLLIVFLLFFSFNNFTAFKDLHKEHYDYIRPICRRIASRTPEDAKIVFANQYIATDNLWQNEYSLESDRMGWPLTYPGQFRPSNVNRYVLQKATHLAIINTRPDRKWNKFRKALRESYHWLYATFPLIDSCYSQYQLFDLELMNKFELKKQEGFNCSIRFDDNIELRKIRGRLKPDSSTAELKLLWTCINKMKKQRYIMLALGENGHLPGLSHRLLGKFYNTDLWSENRCYSQWISFDKKLFNKENIYIYPVLYDTLNKQLAFPQLPNEYYLPVIKISQKNGQLDISFVNDENIIQKFLKIKSDLSKIQNEGVKFLRNELKEAREIEQYNFNSLNWFQYDY